LLTLYALSLQGSAVAGPGGIDPQGARSRQQLVPAPERIWALRNVASNMLRSTASSGGGGSSSAPSAEEAVSMLQQASDLAAEHYGRNHPGVLATVFCHCQVALTALLISLLGSMSLGCQHQLLLHQLCIAKLAVVVSAASALIACDTRKDNRQGTPSMYWQCQPCV
jgi:hypothetical protein